MFGSPTPATLHSVTTVETVKSRDLSISDNFYSLFLDQNVYTLLHRATDDVGDHPNPYHKSLEKIYYPNWLYLIVLKIMNQAH